MHVFSYSIQKRELCFQPSCATVALVTLYFESQLTLRVLVECLFNICYHFILMVPQHSTDYK